jgi:hypothetical protein
MKKLFVQITRILLLLSVSFLLSNCAGYNGLTRNVNNHQTDVVLSQPNYKVIKYVQGESVAKYFLGIGGFNNKGMIAEARQKMLSHAGLTGKSRAVINETVEIRTKQILIYTEFQYIVSAYVVEFSNDPAFNPEPEADYLVYTPEDIKEPTKSVLGATAGFSLSGSDYPKPGFNVGASFMFSKPETVKNLFLENQINITNLNGESQRYYDSNHIVKEHSWALDFPLYVGFKLPVTDNYSLFLKGGPGLGLVQHYEDVYDSNGMMTGESGSGTYVKLSLGGYAGFTIGRVSTAFGLEWMVADFAELSSFKLALTYHLK